MLIITVPYANVRHSILWYIYTQWETIQTDGALCAADNVHSSVIKQPIHLSYFSITDW